MRLSASWRKKWLLACAGTLLLALLGFAVHEALGVPAAALAVAAAGIVAFLLVRDLLARRRSEAAIAEEHNLLRSIIDAMPDHVFLKDIEGHYVLDNAAHRRFLGRQSFTEIEGKTAFDFFPQEIAEMYAAADQKVLQTGEPQFYAEEPAVDREGRLRWLATTKVPLRDTEKKLVGIIGVSADITARRAAEDELRLAAAQLQRSNKDLADFASIASHDLQEPLRKILTFGDRLRTKCAPQLSETGHDYLDRMFSAAQRMQRLIQDLLTLSRITSRAQPFIETDLREIVSGVVSDLEVAIEQSGALIEIGHLPRIDADPLQMRQLFQNLLANALKFQRSGQHPVVNISAKVLEVQEPQIPGAAPGDEVCQIVIQDNGIGFEQKFAEKIFVIFQRLHGRLEYEGTGIGLAVVRRICDRHGGTVTAKSGPDEGATFLVTLPVKQRIKHHHDDPR